MSGSFPASKGLPARIGCGQGDEVIRYEAMRARLGAGYVQNLPRQSPISLLRVPQPTERHANLLNELLALPGVHGNLVPDAHLAALALAHGLTLCSTDGDFARFPTLRWQNPIAA